MRSSYHLASAARSFDRGDTALESGISGGGHSRYAFCTAFRSCFDSSIFQTTNCEVSFFGAATFRSFT